MSISAESMVSDIIYEPVIESKGITATKPSRLERPATCYKQVALSTTYNNLC
jgi:hypothetical protein